MIKIKIQAGLGNQLFQYALARAIKEKTKKEVLLDLSFYTPNGVAKGDIVRGYELDKFNIDKNIKSSYKSTPKIQIILEKIIRRVLNLSSYVFYKRYLNPLDHSYIIGFRQSEKYFKDIEEIIKKEFTLKNKIEDRDDQDISKNILKQIQDSKYSISVNIRRGDYVNNPTTRNHHGLISKDYFIRGVEYINKNLNLERENTNIFIFSDDISWCEANLLELKDYGDIVFVSQNLEPVDSLYLISSCKSNVIANSSFSWWGAWLNTNSEKIIIAPKNWMKAYIDTKDLCPNEWIRLENKFY